MLLFPPSAATVAFFLHFGFLPTVYLVDDFLPGVQVGLACRYAGTTQRWSKYANTFCREENKPEATRRITSVHSRVAQKTAGTGTPRRKGIFARYLSYSAVAFSKHVNLLPAAAEASDRSWRIPRAKKLRARRNVLPPLSLPPSHGEKKKTRSRVEKYIPPVVENHVEPAAEVA